MPFNKGAERLDQFDLSSINTWSFDAALATLSRIFDMSQIIKS